MHSSSVIIYYLPSGCRAYWLPRMLIWLTLNQFTSLWVIKAIATHVLFSTLVFLMLSPLQEYHHYKSVWFVCSFLSFLLLIFFFFFVCLFVLLLDCSYSKKKKLLHGSFETTDNVKVRHGAYLWVSITYYSCLIKPDNKNWWNGLLEEILTF